MPASAPVLLLRECEGQRRVLPIYIGRAEAAAIHVALQGQDPIRPLTHDLIGLVLAELNAELKRVAVVAISEGTFFAEIDIARGELTSRLSVRPSDAVAIAVRLGVDVVVDEEVMDVASQPGDSEQEPGPDNGLVEEFRRFIDDVSPEDFGA